MATLSVFVTPLIHDFGWSRTALSGAVSLGGILAAIVSPAIGPFLDRAGSRLVLCYAILTTGAALLLLSLTPSLAVFYLLFCFARMNWASPFDLGIYGAVNNWFVRRRATATSIATLAQMAGLVAMPLIAQIAMLRGSWREGMGGARSVDADRRVSADLAAAGAPPGGFGAASRRAGARPAGQCRDNPRGGGGAGILAAPGRCARRRSGCCCSIQ